MEAAVRFLRPYVWALLTVVACSGVKVLVGAIIPSSSPYIFFTVAVILIAYNFGFGPGLFTIVASTLVGLVVFERFSFPTPEQPAWQRAATFAIQGLVICYICGVRIKTTLDRTTALEAERAARVELVSTSQELRRSEERYRGMIAAVPQIVFLADPNFQFEWINDRWAGFTGLQEAAASGSGWLEAVDPADRTALEGEIRRALREKQVLNTELRLRERSTGLYRWHLTRAVPVLDHGRSIAQ